MYRDLTRRESTIFNSFLSSWGMFDYFKDKRVVVRERSGKREIYMITDLTRLIDKPVIAGLKICDLRKHASLSIEAIHIFSKYSNKRKITVNKRAEALFLYGRDIFGSSIVKHTNDFDENDPVIVVNINGDAIGIGKTRYSAERIQSNRVTVTNVSDLGIYLREENNVSDPFSIE